MFHNTLGNPIKSTHPGHTSTQFFTFSLTDSLSFQSNSSRTLIHKASLTNSLNFTQSITNQYIHIRSIVDTITLQGTNYLGLLHDLTLNQSLIISQSISSSLVHFASLIHNLSINQLIDSSTIHIRSFSDSLHLQQSTISTASFSFDFTDSLFLTDHTTLKGRTSNISTSSGVSLDVIFDDHVLIEDLNFEGFYKIVDHYTFTVSDRNNDLSKVRAFFNYYRCDTMEIVNFSSRYIAYLDYSENNRRSLDMFSQDRELNLDFSIIRKC